MYFKSQTEVPQIKCFCLEFFQDENSPVTYISQYDYSSLYERLAAYINSGATKYLFIYIIHIYVA
jgi:hypothetical protein